ncbi:MAG: hypothetical protein CEN88_322 [Candidatus Berkelbacteria bacterium Licking1014_2]|uniref:PI3K/PI4K catalytic domain-containing protein n=1 Tax=Candidatus Berkelbacteria bacterium Licking1014_2 TaxID=2017146 RepID=A0A554LUM0_9BACT|nr:MAG: hypothetical protein CEN88_322 [Candidatus Berkelbacteria bacterium Licking1014_2]
MNEELKSRETEINHESRFGDIERILAVMQEGEIIDEKGNINELYDDVPPHANVVEVVELTDVQHRNITSFVKIRNKRNPDETITCVFKPADGESAESKRDIAVQEFYPRECAAFLISDHFELDIVPPTIIREINGRKGALQLFIDHEQYANASLVPDFSLQEGDDFYKVALLDWLLLNCERHTDNLMVKKDDPRELIAIDHGIILSCPDYFNLSLRGPTFKLTYDNKLEKPRTDCGIPKNLLLLLEDGLKRKEILIERLKSLPTLSDWEIEKIFLRIEQLLKSKRFLSKENFQAVFKRSWMSDYLE